MTALKTAFIGLGVMGYPMAGHLAKAGHAVTVHNRTQAKAEAWAGEHGGAVAETPAAAAAEADFVFACVGDDDDLRGVALGADGALAAMQEGAVFIDHTTASAEIAREVHREAQKRRLDFLDAPVSGGQAGAESGALTIMIGGAEEVFARARPVLSAYAREVALMGPVGAGQLTKMVNQICVAGLIQALAEGLNFARQAGLDAKKVVDLISQGAASSWQMANRGDTMLDDEFDFGFAVDWMLKDLAICLAEARNLGAPLPLTGIVNGYYRQIQERGGGRWDTSSLIRLLANPPAVSPPPASRPASGGGEGRGDKGR